MWPVVSIFYLFPLIEISSLEIVTVYLFSYMHAPKYIIYLKQLVKNLIRYKYNFM
jgi:hypothetical protein